MSTASFVKRATSLKSPLCNRFDFTIKLPPQQKTLLFFRYCAILFSSIPPVGINFILGKAADSAMMALIPPKVSAGKNLTMLKPAFTAAIISVGVTQPGM